MRNQRKPARRVGAIKLCLLSLALAVALSACGGGGTTTVVESPSEDTTSGLSPVATPVTMRTVKQCFEDGEAIVESTGPLNPGSPINAEGVFAIGPGGGRVGVAITQHPWLAKRISHELAEESRLSVSISEDRNIVVIFEKNPTSEDEDLAAECIGE